MSHKESPFFVKEPGGPQPPAQQPAEPRDEEVSVKDETSDQQPRKYRGWVPNVRWDVT